MRWLGAASRCHSIALEYARHRQAFGRAIGEHQGVGFMLADNEIDLNLCRLAIWHAAWLLDQGQQARQETSMYKVYCSEALGRVVDRSLQVLGGMALRRHRGRAHLPRYSRVSHLRRTFRSPSLRHRAHRLARDKSSR